MLVQEDRVAGSPRGAEVYHCRTNLFCVAETNAKSAMTLVPSMDFLYEIWPIGWVSLLQASGAEVVQKEASRMPVC